MPYRLDYDNFGNVIGGHYVNELSQHPAAIWHDRRLATESSNGVGGPGSPSFPFMGSLRPSGVTPPPRLSYSNRDMSSDHSAVIPNVPGAIRSENLEPAQQHAGFPARYSYPVTGVMPRAHHCTPTPPQHLTQYLSPPIPANPGFTRTLSTSGVTLPLDHGSSRVRLPIRNNNNLTQRLIPAMGSLSIVPNRAQFLNHTPSTVIDLASGDNARRPDQHLKRVFNTRQKLLLAQKLVVDFGDCMGSNTGALASFEVLCRNFNKQLIDETAFYAGIYRVLYRSQSLHLLPRFTDFLPPLWRSADLTWLHDAIKLEHDRSNETKEQTVSKLATPKIKKKRPVKGFITCPLPRTAVRKVESLMSGTTPEIGSLSTKEQCEVGSNQVRVKRSLIVKLKVPISQTLIRTKTQGIKISTDGHTRSVHDSVANPLKRSASSAELSHPDSRPRKKASRFRCGSTLSSDVPHVGPVFPSRRAILARESKPYIHAACGVSFHHPSDVKGHHGPCVMRNNNVIGDWDAHPSCQIGYRNISYTRVADGYVILDQASFDKITQAIAKGSPPAGGMINANYAPSQPKVVYEAVNIARESGASTAAETGGDGHEAGDQTLDAAPEDFSGNFSEKMNVESHQFQHDKAASRAVALGLRMR